MQLVETVASFKVSFVYLIFNQWNLKKQNSNKFDFKL